VTGRRSERFTSREGRELRRELLISPYPELGLVAMDGPNDPEPGLEVDGGRVVAMDGRRAEDFDVIDRFVALYGLDLEVAAEAAELEDDEIARHLVDVHVPRADLVRLSRGLTPARLARVISRLDPVELMFALKKLRARRVPANQAHVTNLKENPALLAADAAEAAARGFAEDVAAADRVLAEGISALDVIRELDAAGYEDVAEAVLGMQRQRVCADYLQTSAIIEPDGTVRSAVSDPNLYEGPAPATALTASAGSCCSSFRTCSIRVRRARRTEGCRQCGKHMLPY
jgi:propanediol dehydratase large subunit